MKKLKNQSDMIYIAAPFFNKEQVEVVEKIKSVLIDLNIPFFSPKDELGIVEGKLTTFDEREKVFRGNVSGMRSSKLSISVIDDFDKGVLWEMGFLFANHIPIIAYSNVLGRGLNLMLQQSVIYFSNGFDDLKEKIIEIYGVIK